MEPRPSATLSMQIGGGILCLLAGFALGAWLSVRHFPVLDSEAARPVSASGRGAASVDERGDRILGLIEKYGDDALWDFTREGEETEPMQAVVWDEKTRQYSICIEVLRTEAGYFYRRIPAVTRIVDDSFPSDRPIRFTYPSIVVPSLKRGRYGVLIRPPPPPRLAIRIEAEPVCLPPLAITTQVAFECK